MPSLKFLSKGNNENKHKMLHIWNCEQYFHSKSWAQLNIQKQENVHTAVKSDDRLA